MFSPRLAHLTDATSLPADGNNNPQSALVKLELEEMMEGIRQDGIDKVWWDCEWRNGLFDEPLVHELTWESLSPPTATPSDRPLFLSHNGRWRMAQVLMISIFGQFSGNGLGESALIELCPGCAAAHRFSLAIQVLST
jgi:hypothetical protein